MQIVCMVAWVFSSNKKMLSPSSGLSLFSGKPKHEYDSYSSVRIGEQPKSQPDLFQRFIFPATDDDPFQRSVKVESITEKGQAAEFVSLPYEGCSQPSEERSARDIHSTDHKSENLVVNSSVVEKSSSPRESERKIVSDGVSPMSETVLGKLHSYAVEDPSCSSLQPGDKILLLDKISNAGDTVPFAKVKDTLENSAKVFQLTPDDVIKVVGLKRFWNARNTMIHQQRIFSFQIFELHRLIKVQKLILELPEISGNIKFNTMKPSIQFPTKNKLLLPDPLDSLLTVSKPKANSLSEPAAATARNLHDDKFLHSSPKPASDTKLPTWYLHSPYKGPWLVPVRSPSDGIVYKPYTVAGFPTLGLVNTAYGNNGHVSYGIPSPNDRPISRCNGNGVSQSYPEAYSMPLFTANESLATETKAPSQESIPVSDYRGDPHPKTMQIEGSSDPKEPVDGATTTLSLFPTTPTVGGLKNNSSNKAEVQVVKVVPHNRNMAPESAKRIFEFIREERTGKCQRLS